jgi:hypothetical protein
MKLADLPLSSILPANHKGLRCRIYCNVIIYSEYQWAHNKNYTVKYLIITYIEEKYRSNFLNGIEEYPRRKLY